LPELVLDVAVATRTSLHLVLHSASAGRQRGCFTLLVLAAAGSAILMLQKP
jgi:hypothetical protein